MPQQKVELMLLADRGQQAFVEIVWVTRMPAGNGFVLQLGDLLNELLLLKLQYAHLPGAEDLEALTARFLQNQADMQRESKLNLAYAFLSLELQQIHLQGKIVNLTALVITTIRKYKISTPDLMTEPSIARARRLSQTTSERADFRHLPLATGSIDVASLLLSAHELRRDEDRGALFTELR